MLLSVAYCLFYAVCRLLCVVVVFCLFGWLADWFVPEAYILYIGEEFEEGGLGIFPGSNPADFLKGVFPLFWHL